MAGKGKLYDRKVFQIILILVGLIVILLSLFGDKGLLQLNALKVRANLLEEEIQLLREEREIWELRLEALKKGDAYLETLAREELGMVKPKETLILLQE